MRKIYVLAMFVAVFVVLSVLNVRITGAVPATSCTVASQRQTDYLQCFGFGECVGPITQKETSGEWLTIFGLFGGKSETDYAMTALGHFCPGMKPGVEPNDQCNVGDPGVITKTLTVTSTTDLVGDAFFVFHWPANCCERRQVDMKLFNGAIVGSSFFIRQVWGSECVATATPTSTPTSTPTLTKTKTPTNTPTNTSTPTSTATPSVCGWGKLGNPAAKNPLTAPIILPGGALNMEWWSDGGNGTNWVRFIGSGGLVKIWNDRLNPASTRIWVDVLIDPVVGPVVVRKECYALSPCYLHTRVGQTYYIRGTILTRVGCTRWNFDDP